ncbi:wall-associated receptor kinase-like 14 [Bidens hawaiensis]|uniref:wall-associated receptor kinase-like 14 n=1 Tax=Bidens hawaiensis TaxID=980011 RepID=UPI00404B48C9
MLLHFLVFSVIVIVTSPLSSFAKANCTRVCRTNAVQYPFGFSNGCEIRLDCTADGEIRIGQYSVQNITRDHIMVILPAKCDRHYEEIRVFGSQNYAVSSHNGLLLENCSSTLNDCVMSTSRFENRFNLQQCDTGIINNNTSITNSNSTSNNSTVINSNNSNLSCYSEDDPNNEELMNLTSLEQANCQVLFSSISVDMNRSNWSNMPVLFEFQSLELSWWVRGSCGCDQNASCRNVTEANETIGYRCNCNEGFAGDGFAAGEGCRKVAKCGATKYMSGECGGTTRVGVLIGGIIAGASLMSISALICYCLKKRAALRHHQLAKRQLSEATGSFNVPFYLYKEIERATNSFSEKQRLGIGAYGTVYAGKLSTNEWVAVKKIRNRDTDGNGNNQVMNEIKLISTVNHTNLVRLLGYCIEKGEKILVYEYMPNGTLSQHLRREREKGLPWTVRLTIATETAQAIAHLHSMNPPIYHRDIKSSNILLDYNFNSKVADFGLSRLGMLDDSHISTAPQGTPGYVDPQYHQNFHLSDKSDVYSFGVVLVEIITALKVVDFSRHHTEINLAALAIDKIGKGRVEDIIDTFLDPNRDAWTLTSIHKVAELAFRCLAFHRDMRPSMSEVADELEQVRVGGWNTGDDNVTMSSSSVSSSPYNGSERSIGGTIVKKVAAIGSGRRLVVPHVMPECLKITEEKDSSPVSVQEIWLSDQSSPSTNSLLSNVVR